MNAESFSNCSNLLLLFDKVGQLICRINGVDF